MFVTPWYAGILVFWFIVLSVRVAKVGANSASHVSAADSMLTWRTRGFGHDNPIGHSTARLTSLPR